MRIIVGAFFAASLTTAIPAVGQESLLGIYGAWVLENEDCKKIFASDNGRLVFAIRRREPLPGFIISSKSISNNEYLCTVKEYKVQLAEVTFTGQCDFGQRKRRQKFTMQELNGIFRMEIGRQRMPVKRCNLTELDK